MLAGKAGFAHFSSEIRLAGRMGLHIGIWPGAASRRPDVSMAGSSLTLSPLYACSGYLTANDGSNLLEYELSSAQSSKRCGMRRCQKYECRAKRPRTKNLT